MKIKMEDIYDLEDQDVIDYEISYRGGNYGISAQKFIERFAPEEDIEALLPGHIGAYCNYLGGGLRGAICKSDYAKETPARIAKMVDNFVSLCARRYAELEEEMLLNDEGEADDPNWEAMGTNACRRAGIVSNY